MPKCSLAVGISIVVLCYRQTFCDEAGSKLCKLSEMCSYRKLPLTAPWTPSEVQCSQWGSFSELSLLLKPKTRVQQQALRQSFLFPRAIGSISWTLVFCFNSYIHQSHFLKSFSTHVLSLPMTESPSNIHRFFP